MGQYKGKIEFHSSPLETIVFYHCHMVFIEILIHLNVDLSYSYKILLELVFLWSRKKNNNNETDRFPKKRI